MCIEFFLVASDCDTIDNGSNSNIVQPSNSSTKSNNIRRQPSRTSSEQSTESMTNTKKNSFFCICLKSLASICQPRSPSSSNISVESGYDSNSIAQAMHHSLNSSNTERR